MAASLDLEHLQAFADVIELGSFSAAAERRGLTQPAVSLRIRQLERRLGARLIERVGRRATPTAAGAELLAHAARIAAQVDAAVQAVQAHTAGVAGRVALGTGATACAHLLPAVLADLRKRFPALDVVVRTGNTSDVLRALEENRLDIGLVTLPARGRMFHITPVLRDEFVAIAARPLRRRLTPDVLAGMPLVLFEPGAQTRRLVDDWFARAGVAARPFMELGSTEAIREIAGAGVGCGILPAMAVPAAAARGLALQPLAPRLWRELAVVVRRDKPLGRGLAQVADALLALGGKRPRAA